jgi:hypothetical protein
MKSTRKPCRNHDVTTLSPGRLSRRDPDALGHGIAVSFYELVHHTGHLVEREYTRTMAIELGGGTVPI